MSNWKKVKLSTLCTRIGDGLHGTPTYIDHGEIFFINGNNLRKGKIIIDLETKKVSENEYKKNFTPLNINSLLIGINGTIGNMAFFNNEKLMLGKSSAYLNFKTEINRFYYYYFQLPAVQKYFYDVATGSTIKNLSLKALQDFEVPLPEKEEYEKIIAVLSALDEKIEVNNEINKELEQLAKTLYDYWFVQFDFPNAEGKPYKSCGGEMEYNPILKKEIPKNWKVKSLYEIANFINGLACQKYRPENEEDESLPVIKIREMNDGISINTEKVSINIPEKNIINDGDVLFSWSATLDVKIWTEGKAGLNQHIFKVTSDVYPRSFYYFEVLNYLHHFKMMAELRKTTMGHITIDHLKSSFISIPPSDLINKLDNKLNPILEKFICNSKQNQELSKLRNWLLTMLMNGQVKIADLKEVNEQQNVVIASSTLEQFKLNDKDKKVRRKMLATYIINQSLKDTSFGKTKFEKLLHLIECHIVRGDYNQKYSVQAAGPYDGGFTKIFWDEVTKAKWFKIEELGKLRRIMPAENHAKSLVDYGYLSNDLKLMINDFIEKFKNSNYERPEIVSTLYAVWNNRIIRKEMITDELLKKDFLEWDAQKSKYKDRLENALEWMRENGIIPDGWGSEIRRAENRNIH